jgi:hypothetical protein
MGIVEYTERDKNINSASFSIPVLLLHPGFAGWAIASYTKRVNRPDYCLFLALITAPVKALRWVLKANCPLKFLQVVK